MSAGVVGLPGCGVAVEPGLDLLVGHAGCGIRTASFDRVEGRVAASSRSSARSLPSATSVSNRGGVAVRPVDGHADRHEQVAGLPAVRFGEGAQRRLELVRLERHGAGGGDRRRARRAARRCVVAASQRFGTSIAGSIVHSIDATGSRPARRSAPSVGRRSWTIGMSGRSSSAVGTRSIRPAARSASRNGSSRSIRSSGSSLPDPLAVQPLEAVLVEDRAALVDVVEVEARRQLVEREDLLLRARRPAEQRQEVDDRLGQEALRRGSRRSRSGSCACSSWCGRG